ncbi:MAG: SIR2 family protein [Candidatus Caenarcaniphilales bacterium]|nr:SIR2 family protein [Candidatus Caenarcaniphilales bacterium]
MNEHIDWNHKHILKTNTERFSSDDDSSLEANQLRLKVEPWLSTIFQSEHFSLLIGTGLTQAVANIANIHSQDMSRVSLNNQEYTKKIRLNSDNSAAKLKRGKANFEDDLRISLELLRGYEILDDENYDSLKEELNEQLSSFIKNVLATEESFLEYYNHDSQEISERAISAFQYLCSFLLSFTSRAASRERLNIFTTNYDRFLEYGCDEIGLLLLDRFKGKLQPVFRNTKLELDYHYNPPGIRGEPRYVEGVARLTKLHGSIDWQFQTSGKIIKSLLPFGASDDHPSIDQNPTDHAVIYPNSSKDIETAFYPYSELFRDFSNAICRPNSSIVTYGYGFGDSHINRIISDMFTIPSTHIVIIAYDDKDKRIYNFLKNKNTAQYTLLLGDHFGNLTTLVDNYLPKSAIDRLTIKMNELIHRRAINEQAEYPKEETKKGV